MRARNTLLVLAVAAMSVTNTLAAEADGVAGKIDAVTVYRGQALVTRVIDTPQQAGLREIVVTNLPERVVPSSVYAEADNGVEVRGLRFRTRPVTENVREDVRKLEAQLQDLGDQHDAVERQRQVLAERKDYLGKLDNFTAPAANTELQKGVLNADTLKSLTLFVFEQRKQLADEELQLNINARGINQQISVAQRQLSDLTRGASKLVREAVILADVKQGATPLRVKYLVDSASWSPSYVARADSGGNGRRPVAVQYNASVQQMSGEDWADVTMTLSTATPSLVAAAPQLDPLTITLAAASDSRAESQARFSYADESVKLKALRAQAETSRNNFSNINAPAAPQQSQQGFGGGGVNLGFNAQPKEEFAKQDAELNGIAGRLQVLELVAKDSAATRVRAKSAASDQEGVSVSYALPARTSLPSRIDQQSIRIANLSADGEFYKLAMPVLTSYVYDQASVTNPGPMVLLAGPVASYLDGQYVGLGSLPTVAVGEQFTVGFGIDSSLRATRELVDKSETTQGGNRVLSFSYKLTIENFGKTPATIRVTDRLPTSPDPDVKVTMVSATSQPTTKPAMEQSNTTKRTGVISWTLTAGPETLGEKAAALGYQYKLEFDKQLNIAGLSEK